MRVRDLGPLTLSVGARDQPLAGSRATTVLAVLTAHVNNRVSVDALVEAVWGDHASPGSVSTLESHVWRLRKLLEPDRDPRVAPAVLLNDSGGYRLVGGPATVDSVSFADLTSEARELLAAGDASTALRKADSALALWRGPPYGTLGDNEWAQPAVARLTELRDQVRERRIEALLALGQEDLALSEVQPLILETPFRESLRVLQMQALYRSGRTEQSLAAYQEARRTLLDEVGIEPGHQLQEMHRRILRQDATLDPSPAAVRLPARQDVHLPASLTPLVGRQDDLAAVVPLVREHRLVTITGAAGCGKTRLAVEVARGAATSFPDGVWFIDLTAVNDPDLVADVVISSIGFNPSAGATPLQDLRQYLQTRRLLLVLDNCEHVLDAVDEIARATLGDPSAAPECCLLATSREPVSVDGETVWMLQPLQVPEEGCDLDEARRVAAVEVFLQRLAAVAPALEVDREAMSTVVDITRAVDGLPLPLELAAARAYSYSLAEIAAQVTADPSRLGRPGRTGGGPSDHRRTVRSAIDWSHRLLSPPEQTAHRRLSVLPGAFTVALAGAVVGDVTATGDGSPIDPDVDSVLAALVHRSMLSPVQAAGPAEPTTFRQLATVRSHARHAATRAAEVAECGSRRDAWVTELVMGRPPLGSATEPAWYRRIDHDYSSVRATLATVLLEAPDPPRALLAARLTHYWYYRQRVVEGNRWLQLAHSTLADAPPSARRNPDRLIATLSLAAALSVQGRVDAALPHLADLARAVRTMPEDRLVEVGESLVGVANALYVRDAGALFATVHEQLTWVVQTVSDANLALLTDAVGSCGLVLQGRIEQAVTTALEVQGRADAADNSMAAYVATAPLMVGALVAGRPAEGIPWVDRCLRTHLRFGIGAAGMFIENRANLTAQSGDFEEAARLYAAARAQTRRAAMVWPRRPLTHELLAATREQLSARDYERAWHEGEQLSPYDIVDRGR